MGSAVSEGQSHGEGSPFDDPTGSPILWNGPMIRSSSGTTKNDNPSCSLPWIGSNDPR